MDNSRRTTILTGSFFYNSISYCMTNYSSDLFLIKVFSVLLPTFISIIFFPQTGFFAEFFFIFKIIGSFLYLKYFSVFNSVILAIFRAPGIHNHSIQNVRIEVT